MKVKTFILGSSSLFALWLGITFVHKLPLDQYPLLGKKSLTKNKSTKADKAVVLEKDQKETPDLAAR